MARNWNKTGHRSVRNSSNGELFGVTEMYRGIPYSRNFKISRADLLPTIPSGTEMEETSDASEDANVVYGSNRNSKLGDVSTVNYGESEICSTAQSPGICQTDNNLILTSNRVSTSQPFDKRHSSDSASKDPEYTRASQETPTRFLEDNFTSRKRISNTHVVGRFTTNKEEIRETSVNLVNAERPKSCGGCRTLQKDAKELFADSGLPVTSEAKLHEKPDKASGIHKISQSSGTSTANERIRAEISEIGTSCELPIRDVDPGFTHVKRFAEDSRKLESIGQANTATETELNAQYSSKAIQAFEEIPYTNNTEKAFDVFATCNTISHGRNEEFLSINNCNPGISRLQQTSPVLGMPNPRDTQELPRWRTSAYESPNDKWFPPNGLFYLGSVDVGSAGAYGGGSPIGGRSARLTEASCAPAVIPRGVGFPKHARMFGASMPHRNQGGVDHCGISLLPRVCRSVRSRNGTCHRGYTHPILRTITGSGKGRIHTGIEKTRGKRRRPITNAVDNFSYAPEDDEANSTVIITPENVELESAVLTPITGVFLETQETGGISRADHRKYPDNETTPQKTKLTTRKRPKRKKR